MLENETLWPTTRDPQPLISDEELEYLFVMDKEEILWRDSQPKYSFSELMRIFPEAITAARRGLKVKLKIYKLKLKSVNTQQEDYYDRVIAPAHFTEQAELKEESDKEFDEVRKKWTSKIKTTMFNLSHLDELEGKVTTKKTGGVAEEDVARAKEIPIIDLLSGPIGKHGNRAVTYCPFHTEKQPSFTIYLDQNSFFCYSCNWGGSVIDFVMRQQNVDFLTAVKQLLK